MGQGISAALADEIAIQQKPRALRRRSSIGRNGEEDEEGSFVSCFSDEETGLSRKSIRPIYININHRKPLDPPCTVSAARVPSDPPPYFRSVIYICVLVFLVCVFACALMADDIINSNLY